MTPPSPETTSQKKQSILNILAIFGFLAIVLLVAWLSLLFVQVLPSTFNSLASIAESLYGPNQKPLVITNPTPEIVSGDTIELGFAEQTGKGSYTFSYSCHDGVSLTLIDGDTIQPLRCDMVYSTGEKPDTSLTATSDTAASVLVTYTVTYLRTNDSKPRAEGSGNLVITNPDVATNQPPVSSETVVEVTIGNNETASPTSSVAVAPQRPTKPAQQFQTFSYIPPSQVNGFTDLQVSFIELGVIRNNILSPRLTFTRNSENFFRFEIKNIGTKTSDQWRFTTSLPSGNVTVRDNQFPLKPNERAVITVRFPVTEAGTARAQVSVSVPGDRVSTNDNLLRSVAVQ